MPRSRRAVPALLAALVLAACGGGGADDGVSGPSGSTTAPTSQSPSPSPTPTDFSPFSNRLGGLDQPILVAKIDNTRSARPHLGLTQADVVWVEEVETGITRFAVLFSSRLPEVVGPIRSARSTDIDLLAPFGKVAFSYSGAQSRLRPALSAADFLDVSGDRGARGYFRAKDRVAPYNFMGRPAELLERAGDGVARSRAGLTGWVFDDTPVTTGRTVLSVTARWPSQSMTFTWNPLTRTWDAAVDSRALEAAEGGVVSADTVIVQYVRYTDSGYRDRWGNRTPEAQLRGSGEALVLRDGVALPARWSRPGESDVTQWTDPSGAPLALRTGVQWILLVSQAKPVALVEPTPTASPSGSSSGSPSRTASGSPTR